MDATNVPFVNRRGVDASFDDELSDYLKDLFCTASELTYGCAARKEGLTVDGPTIRRSWSRRWGL